MAGLSRGHVGELVRELTPLLCGLSLREAQAHPPRDVLFVLEPGSGGNGGPIRRLRVSASPEGARLHLQMGSVKRHTGALGPFFRRLHEELEGATLRELAQIAGDRIVRLDWKLPSGGSRTLIAELFGRHANLILLDPGGRILGTLAEPARDSAAAKRLAVGLEWHPPAGAPKKDPGAATKLVDDLPAPPDPPERAVETARLAPLSWRVECSIGLDADSRYDTRQRKDLSDRLRRRLKSARHRLSGLHTQAEGANDAERVRMDAELLTAHLTDVKRGMAEIELADAHDPEAPPRRIALDRGLSPRRNAERLFARAKKLARVREKLPDEIALCERQIAGLEDLVERAGDTSIERAETEREAVAGGWLPERQAPPKRKRPEKRLPYHTFSAKSGAEIRVGRSARENDTLTFRHARGNDLWLHTSDAPGSHVVLVVPRGGSPEPEDVLDAAHLAVHFSPLRESSKTGVHIAPQKGVKKPRKAPAGLVSVSGGKIRMIRVEAERIERLLASRAGPRPGADSRRGHDSGSQERSGG